MNLQPEKVKGRIKTLKVLPYKGSMVYIRQIDEEIFEYLLVFNNEIYSSYLIITPKIGEKKLNEDEIAQSAALILSGATATIDTLLGEEVSEEKKDIVKTFEDAGKKIFGKEDKNLLN